MIPLRFLPVAATLFLSIALGACSSGPAAQDQSQGQAAATRSVTAYQLGPSDRLRVTVFGHPDLSGEFEIDGTGAISLPLIGQVSAAGLSTQGLEGAVAARLADGYVLNPKVSAEVINYRPYYILGEVGRPGEYPYSAGLTVQNAVAAAGGFTYRANKRVVFIKRKDAGSEIAYELNPATTVEPGDTLRIGERIF